MSYLKGPLKKREISELMKEEKNHRKISQDSDLQPKTTNRSEQESYEVYNTLDNSISQYYEVDVSGVNQYLPTLGAKIRVGFYSQSRGIDEAEESILRLPLDIRDRSADWGVAQSDRSDFGRFPRQMPSDAKLKKIPDFIRQDKGLKKIKKLLEEMLYQQRKLELY